MIAMTWRNLFVLVFCIPLRIVLLIPLWLFMFLGKHADRVWDVIDETIPALTEDPEWQKQQNTASLTRLRDSLLSQVQKTNSADKLPEEGAP